MALSTVALGRFPENPIHIIAFTGLENAADLRAELLEGNPDFEYAFLDGSMVLSPRSVFASIFRALTDLHANRLRTKNIHSEIVFCMNSNNNISESFRRFGLTDSTTSVLAIKVGTRPVSSPLEKFEDGSSSPSFASVMNGSITPSADAVFSHLTTHVKGTPLQCWTDICELADLSRIQKVHKIPAIAPVPGETADERQARERRHVEGVLTGLIAIRGG